VYSSCEHPIASTDGNFASIQLALAEGELLIESGKKEKGSVIRESRKTKLSLAEGIYNLIHRCDDGWIPS
jgi:hypothetical protein